MGRQWLHAKRAIVNLKKGQMVGKIVKEITVAAKLGGPELEANARLFAAVEKAKKQSVTRDVIERAIGAGKNAGRNSRFRRRPRRSPHHGVFHNGTIRPRRHPTSLHRRKHSGPARV